MSLFSVKQYRSEDYEVWNRFVSQAKNATFLFHRDFMDYHKDRFEDYSLLIYNEKQKLVAILPANRVGASIYSHQGLTYGGIIWLQKNKLLNALPIYKSILKYLNEKGIQTIQFKLLPAFYVSSFSDELEYLLFVSDATKIQCNCFSTIPLNNEISLSETRKQLIKKVDKNKFEIKEEVDLSSFWNEVLIPNLKETFNSKPLHNLQEIKYLKSKFPNNIRHFSVYENGVILAGMTFFVTKKVVHTQYISTKKVIEYYGVLDYLIHHLMTDVFKEYDYFDFGSSNENNGRQINAGLLFWKESFGAKTVIQNFYQVETANFELLNTVLR